MAHSEIRPHGPESQRSDAQILYDIQRTLGPLPDNQGELGSSAATEPQAIVVQYPAISLLKDARSYAETPGPALGLSGEQLRTVKSIVVARNMANNNIPALLGDQAQPLQPGYAIYRTIVQEGIAALGQGDNAAGQARMEAILSVHDLVKSSAIAAAVEEKYGVTDHDVGLSRLAADNFAALEGRVDSGLIAGLRSMIADDPVLRLFLEKERGIDPDFNIGRHLQGESGFTLFEKTVHEINPVSAAEFVLDLLGGDGNTNPTGLVKFSNIPPAFNGIASGLKKLIDARTKNSSHEDLYAVWQELAYPEADLRRLGLNRASPQNVAVTRLAFMGREHQKADQNEAQENIAALRAEYERLDTKTAEEITAALQDTSGLDIGFAPHTFDSLQRQLGVPAAYAHLMDILGQLCAADGVRTHTHGEPLTINLNNKFDWSGIGSADRVRVIVGPPDSAGVLNADFSYGV